MSRPVRVSPSAKKDVRRIVDMIRDRVSPASSMKLALRIDKAIAELADSADTHPEAAEAAILGRPICMRLVGKRPHVYRILFTFTSDEVYVHRIRHAAQDYLSEDDL